MAALGVGGGRGRWLNVLRAIHPAGSAAYRDVTGPVPFTKEQAGRDEQCVSLEMTTTESSDGCLAAGDRPWSLCFVHTNDGWGLYDQGFI